MVCERLGSQCLLGLPQRQWGERTMLDTGPRSLGEKRCTVFLARFLEAAVISWTPILALRFLSTRGHSLKKCRGGGYEGPGPSISWLSPPRASHPTGFSVHKPFCSLRPDALCTAVRVFKRPEHRDPFYSGASFLPPGVELRKPLCLRRCKD